MASARFLGTRKPARTARSASLRFPSSTCMHAKGNSARAQTHAPCPRQGVCLEDAARGTRPPLCSNSQMPTISVLKAETPTNFFARKTRWEHAACVRATAERINDASDSTRATSIWCLHDIVVNSGDLHTALQGVPQGARYDRQKDAT